MTASFRFGKIYPDTSDKNYILCNSTDKITYIFRQDYILQDWI